MSNYEDYCATCKRALSKLSRGGVITYLHAASQGVVDHEPLPVPLSELSDAIMLCDFCSAPEPRWMVECEAPILHEQESGPRVVSHQEVRVGRYAGRVRDTSAREARRWGTYGDASLHTNAGEKWTACDPCSQLVRAGDMWGLVARVVDAMPAKLSRGNKLAPLRARIAGMYEHIFATQRKVTKIDSSTSGA